jgi:hypothetical protein
MVASRIDDAGIDFIGQLTHHRIAFAGPVDQFGRTQGIP